MPRLPIAMSLVLSAVAASVFAGAPTPPETVKRPVTDTYHGVTVTDDYRWLEDWNDNAVKAWSAAQNSYARSFLDNLPERDAITARVTEILSAPTVSYFGLEMSGNSLLGFMRQPPHQQPFLVSWDDPSKLNDAGANAAKFARIIVDPNTIDTTGKTTIDWFRPSPDGKLVAVSLSKGGSESGDVHVYETATGKEMFEVIPRVNGGTAGGSLAWAPDSHGFYYTRYPRAGERPGEDMNFYMQVYFHALGTSTEGDRFETGKDLPRVAEIALESLRSSGSHNGAILASVQKGDGGEFIHFLRSPKGGWTQLTRYEDRVVQAIFGPDDALYMISRKDAPRGKMLRMSLDSPTLASAKVIVPEGADTLVSEFEGANNIAVTDSLIYATYQLGGPSEVRVFTHAGEARPAPKQLPVGALGGFVRIAGDTVFFNDTSYTAPPAWYRFDAAAGTTSKTALASSSIVSFDDFEAVRETAVSKDGTKIPVNIIRKKGTKLDGNNPCLVNGYGGFGINIEPGFRAGGMVLLERGFVIAIANIRGGGEFGDEWHRQGNLTHKQNCFDDFAAACRHMIDAGYTTPARLAIEGGSNGGLLMGATLTQHPDLMRAVVSHVGIYDMLRVELSSNGAFNITEYGSVKDPAQFKALYAYSPLHNVRNGTAYPAVLFMTGANDPRVDPMQSRKMTASLQAATTSDPAASPILLRTSMDSGHGGGTPLNEAIAQAVDADAFLCHMVGAR
jgi:prolyl oligopeptidase